MSVGATSPPTSCRDQEGIRGSEEAVPGPSVFPSGEPGVSGNRGRSACGPTHVARFEFPRETGLLLRCAGKAGNPFQTKQGNGLSCRDQEGRRGSYSGLENSKDCIVHGVAKSQT